MSNTTSDLQQQTGTSRGFSRAFTVVELILVTVVVGILMAITVVGYGAWRTRVAETEVESDLHGMRAGMESARNASNEYPVFPAGTEFDSSNNTRSIFAQSEGVEITYARGDTESYCINARSVSVSSVYMYLDTAGGNDAAYEGTC